LGGRCSVGSVLNRGNVNVGEDSVYNLGQHYGEYREMSYTSLKIRLWVSGQLFSWVPCLYRRYMWYFSRVFKSNFYLNFYNFHNFINFPMCMSGVYNMLNIPMCMSGVYNMLNKT
jgi:hypothetical protein